MFQSVSSRDVTVYDPTQLTEHWAQVDLHRHPAVTLQRGAEQEEYGRLLAGLVQ